MFLKSCRTLFSIAAFVVTASAQAQIVGGGLSPVGGYPSSGPYSYGQPMEMLCASVGGQFMNCPAIGQIVSAQLIREESGSWTCNYGSTWGYDSNSVWVSQGCRATFQIYVTTGNGGGYPPPYDPGRYPPGRYPPSGGYGSMTTCTAVSRGLSFSDTQYDEYFARNNAVNECERNPYTSNAECQRSVVCNSGGGGGYPPPYNPPPYNPPPSYRQTRCDTWSAGRSFSEVDYDQAQAQRRVLSACTASFGNSRQECVSNLRCYSF